MAYNRPFSLYWQEFIKEQRLKELAEEEARKKLQEEQNFESLYQEDTTLFTAPEDDIFKNTRDLEMSVKESLDPAPYNSAKYSLTDLKNNPEFSKVSERFMDAIGRNENIFEYLRDANFSLSSAIQRAAEVKEFDEQTVQDYQYLRQKFDNAEIGNFKERLGLVKDLGGDILLDPLNWLTALFAIPSGGTALGARAVGQAAVQKALAELAKQGSKRYVKSKFTKDIKKETAKRFGILGAAEGATWSGLHDYFMQDIDINLGFQDEIDLNRIGISTALGTLFGGAVGAGIGKYAIGSSYSKMLEKEYKFANEAGVDVYVGRFDDDIPFYKLGDEQPEYKQPKLFDEDDMPPDGPQPKDDPKPKPNPRQEEEEIFDEEEAVNSFLNFKNFDFNKFNPLEKFAELFVYKPTTKFVKALKKAGDNVSPTMMNNLRKLRLDIDRGILKASVIGNEQSVINLPKSYADEFDIDGPKTNQTTQSYGDYFGKLIGKYHVGLEQAFGVLGFTGVFRTKLVAEDNINLKRLMQSKDLNLIRERQTLGSFDDSRRGAYTGKETIYAKEYNPDTGFTTFSKEIKVGDTHNGIVLTPELHFAYRRLRGLYDDVYDLGVEEGLIDSSVSKYGYFPRIFNYAKVSANRGVLEKRIIDAGHADPNNTKQLHKDFVDMEGIDIPEANYKFDLGVDYNTFSLLKQSSKYNTFQEQAAYTYFRQLSKDEQKAIRNSAEVKAFLKENKLKPDKAYMFYVDKVTKENKDLKIDLALVPNTQAQAGEINLVSLYEFAQIQKSKHIVDDMLNKKFIPQELKALSARYGEGSGFLQSRVFTNIKDKDLEEFVENDVMTVSNKYFNNAAQMFARARYFGKNIGEMEDNIFKPAFDELVNSGMSKEMAGEMVGEFRKVIKKVSGLDDSHLQSWWNQSSVGRGLGDFLKLSQQMAHLPLATLSSITEPMILLTRDFSTETAGTIGKSLVSETGNMFDRIGRTLQRARGKKVQGRQSFKRLGIDKTEEGEYFNVGQFSDDDWFELYQTGLALEQTVMERIEGLAGEALHGSVFKGAQNMFFKSNLLTQWTRSVQLASYVTGKRIIRQHARVLATNKTDLGNKLSDAKRRQLTEELIDLNINPAEAIAWYKRSALPNGKLNENFAKGLTDDGKVWQVGMAGKEKDFIANAQFNKKLIEGANRFTKEIILNPSVQEANRPLWFSNPNAQFLMQFAGYPTVFTNTVLRKFAREVAKDGGRREMYRVGRILPTVMLMTAVAHVGNELRSNGKATYKFGTDEKKSNPEIIKDAWRRWGGLGPLDYAERFANERERGTGFIAETAKSFTGPIPQDIIDSVLYRKGLGELTITNLPYFQLYDNIFGEGTKKKLKSFARGSTPRTKTIPTRLDFERGGLVYNVPNVPNEPDERLDKVTKQMYNSTSESVQDVEDRALKGQMEGLGLRKEYKFGGLVTKFLTFGNDIVKNYKANKISFEQANKEFTKLESSAKTEQQKMFTDWLKTQHEDIVNELRRFENKINEQMGMPKDEDIAMYAFNQNFYEEQINNHPFIKKFIRENPEAERIKKLLNQKDDIFVDMSLHFMNPSKGFKGLKYLNKGFQLDEVGKKRRQKLSRKKYGKDNMGNEGPIDMDLNPKDAKLIEEEVPFTNTSPEEVKDTKIIDELEKKRQEKLSQISVFDRMNSLLSRPMPKKLKKLRKTIDNKLDKLNEKYYKNENVTSINNFGPNSEQRAQFIENHAALFHNFHAENPTSGETISTFIKEIKNMGSDVPPLPDIYNKLSKNEIKDLEKLFLEHNILYNKYKYQGLDD